MTSGIDGTGVGPVTIHYQRHFARRRIFATANAQHAVNALNHRLQPVGDFIQNLCVIALEPERKDFALLGIFGFVVAPEVQLDARLFRGDLSPASRQLAWR